MTTHRSLRLTGMRARIKRTWSELDYTNRRMFYIRTGAHFINGAPEKKSAAALHAGPRFRPTKTALSQARTNGAERGMTSIRAVRVRSHLQG